VENKRCISLYSFGGLFAAWMAQIENDCSVESTKVSRFFTYNNLIKGILSRDFVDRQMNLIGRNHLVTNISTVFLFFFKFTFLFNTLSKKLPLKNKEQTVTIFVTTNLWLSVTTRILQTIVKILVQCYNVQFFLLILRCLKIVTQP
jgi:hypothetical protein